MMSGPGVVSPNHTEEDMNLALSQPWCSIGSDGSALATEGLLRRGNPHPRNFGTFPRVLGRYVRELKVIPLEEAIRKMTSLPARHFGFAGRGVIKEGAAADLVLFNADTISDTATYAAPHAYPAGLPHVLVNGVFVVRDSKVTGARPGQVLTRIRARSFHLLVDDVNLRAVRLQ